MPKQIKNKGGRPATGKVRTVKFMAEFSPEEREYLSRKVHSLRQDGEDVSQNGLIVKRTFPRGWEYELENLRAAQRGVSKKLIWTPK